MSYILADVRSLLIWIPRNTVHKLQLRTQTCVESFENCVVEDLAGVFYMVHPERESKNTVIKPSENDQADKSENFRALSRSIGVKTVNGVNRVKFTPLTIFKSGRTTRRTAKSEIEER